MDLDKALVLKNAPSSDRDFAIPMVYSASWHLAFEGLDSLNLQVPFPDAEDNPVFTWRWERAEMEGHHQLSLHLQIKQCYIQKKYLPFYMELYKRLRSNAQIEIFLGDSNQL